MRKLKAIIVKHENRIRALEATVHGLVADRRRAEEEHDGPGADLPIQPDEV